MLSGVYALLTLLTSAMFAAASGADSKYFVLRSLVPSSMRTAHVLPPERAADRGFEMMVLAMVTMNGETMREGTQLGPALFVMITIATATCQSPPVCSMYDEAHVAMLMLR